METTSSSWSAEEEELLVKTVRFQLSDFWEKVAQVFPERTEEEVKRLVSALFSPSPSKYASSSLISSNQVGGEVANLGHSDRNLDDSSSRQEGFRRMQWTEEEHRRFLRGLKECDTKSHRWKIISRDYVKSRTHLQVASHAQKYFAYKSSSNTRGRRRSILDITHVGKDKQNTLSASDSSPHPSPLIAVGTPLEGLGGDSSPHPPLVTTIGTPLEGLGGSEGASSSASGTSSRPSVPEWFFYF